MYTILIVDDDAAIGDLEQEVLTRAGYAVVRAYSGTEALLAMKDRRPDLILLDLMLPGLSGEELLPQIRDIPVIVVSAKAAVQDKVELLLGGAADYLTKPFDTQELLARVAVRLRERPASVGAAAAGLPPGDRRRNACGADPDGVCHFEAAGAEPGAGAGQIRAAGTHRRRHARLHRKLPEDPHQPPAGQAARGHGEGVHRGGVGHRLSDDALNLNRISTVSLTGF